MKNGGARQAGMGLASDDQDAMNASLSWKDLTVVVKNNKTILHGLSGVAEPGRLLAIMGPSGSGKSSLLDTLAGRPSRDATVTGQILQNGNKAKLSYGSAAFLAQEVVLLGTLTVYETVYFSAKLRFPDSMQDWETRCIVKKTIAEMGLNRCIDTPIGSWYRRGISGGEKRRVSIAIELLTSPRLLFLDEPTSGLDSASSYHVLSILKTLASHGRTVISSIHQPSSDVFGLFDDLCLMSTGRQVYFGPLPGALEFFAHAGFPCPSFRYPAYHYLLSINSDFDEVHIVLKESGSAVGKPVLKDIVEEQALSIRTDPLRRRTTAEAVKTLIRSFASSKEKQDVDARVSAMSKLEGKALDSKGSQASFVRQSYILTKRSFVNMSRDVGYYWLRLAMYIVLAIAIGRIYHNVGYTYTSIQVFGMERLNGHYGVGAFVVGNTLSSVPLLFLISLVTTVIVYFQVDLHHGAQHFLYFVLMLFACLLGVESLMMAVASLVPNFLMGIVIGAAILGLYILVGGFYRLPNDLPKPVWRYPLYYITFLSYAYQGMLINDLKGLNFENLNPADPRLTGEYILRQNYQVQVSRSKWWDLAILFLMIVLYRALFYALIKFSETVLPIIRVFMSKILKISNFMPKRLAAPKSDLEFSVSPS